ncbi:ROK family transcriptional regulator [Photobacterium makurazakiensis]
MRVNLTNNEKYLLGVIHRAGKPISRPEIAEVSTLTFQSVSRIVKGLHAQGILIEVGIQSEGRGKPRVCYQINAHFGFSAGVIFDNGSIAVCLIDMQGQLIKAAQELITFSDPGTIATRSYQLLHQLLLETNIPQDNLLGLGVSIPARIKGEAGQYIFAAKFQEWDRIDIQALFASRFSVPVYIGNDAVNAAVGESFQGYGKCSGDFYFIFIGHGIGSVAIENGVPRIGANGHAGELSMLFKGLMPNTNTLKQFLFEAGIDWDGTSPLTYEQMSSSGFDRWVSFCAQELSSMIEIIIALMDPPAIVIGGTLGPSLIQPIINHLALSSDSKKKAIVYSTPVFQSDTERHTPAYGAAFLPLSNCVFK